MIAYSKCDGKLICSFSGRLDTAFCLETEEEILTHCEEALCPIVFDLDAVEYISSTFLRICLRVAKAAGMDSFSIVRVPAPLFRVFKVAGFDKLLTMEAP